MTEKLVQFIQGTLYGHETVQNEPYFDQRGRPVVPMMDYMEERKGSFSKNEKVENKQNYIHTEDDDKFHEMVSAQVR